MAKVKLGNKSFNLGLSTIYQSPLPNHVSKVVVSKDNPDPMANYLLKVFKPVLVIQGR